MKKNTCNQCGACCIAPSISSSIPGMPWGKSAGLRCINLTEDNRCGIFGSDSRPVVCLEWTPSKEFCGASLDDAIVRIGLLEKETG